MVDENSDSKPKKNKRCEDQDTAQKYLQRREDSPRVFDYFQKFSERNDYSNPEMSVPTEKKLELNYD